MDVNFDKLKDFFLKDAFIISNHARVRMFQRNISTEEIENVIANGEMMKPDRCSFCKGKLIIGKTEFIAKVRDQILVIKNVSALICNECGETYFSPDESRKIDKLMSKFHDSNLLVHPIPAGELSLGEVAA